MSFSYILTLCKIFKIPGRTIQRWRERMAGLASTSDDPRGSTDLVPDNRSFTQELKNQGTESNLIGENPQMLEPLESTSAARSFNHRYKKWKNDITATVSIYHF